MIENLNEYIIWNIPSYVGAVDTSLSFATVRKWIENDLSLSNIFSIFFIHNVEDVYKTTHVKKDDDRSEYNAQLHVWTTIRRTVRNMLRFSDVVPTEKPINVSDVPEWIQNINKMPYKIIANTKHTLFEDFKLTPSQKNRDSLSVSYFNNTIESLLKEHPATDKLNLPANVPSVLIKRGKWSVLIKLTGRRWT